MPSPSLKELNKVTKLLARERGIKGYKNMSKDKVLGALIASENENKTNAKSENKTRTKEIRKINKITT